MKTVAFHTLGCKVNQYDTQAMLELFEAAGYQPVPFPDRADVYVINTCTVTGTGDRKSLQLARRVRREHPDSELVLCGCLAQRLGEALLEETGARLVLGTQRRNEVVTLLETALREDRRLVCVAPLTAAPFEEQTVTRQEEHTRAVMKIQEGCNNFCTYCVIPSVRGPIRSRPLSSVRAEAERLARAGYRELVLTGIHLTSYGRDLPDMPALADAIDAASLPEGIRRIRLGSLEPVIVTERFVRRLADNPRLCPQFHLALQSGSDTVLRRMARRYNTAMYREAASLLRSAWPKAALTTDILTGFPGETEEEHRQPLAFAEEMGFARLHVFPYSPREGTRAAVMPDQVPQEVKDRRVRELIALGRDTARRYQEAWLGETAEVLLETEDKGRIAGYTPEYLPVSLPAGAGSPGQIIRVRLLSIENGTMTGEAV